MIIEFIGIPGSGKTFISKQLEKYLKDNLSNKVKIFNSHDLVIKVKNDGKINNIIKLIPLLLNLSFLKLFKNIILRQGNISSNLYLFKIFLIRLLMYKKINEISKNNKEFIFILEEGWAHFSIALLRKKIENMNTSILDQYFKYLNDVVKYFIEDNYYIFIDSCTSENYIRIENRSKGWPGSLGNESKKKKEKFLNESNNFYKYLKSYYEFNGISTCIDNTKFKNSYSSDFKLVIDNYIN